MANNELSGPSVVTYLSKWLMELEKQISLTGLFLYLKQLDQLHT